MIGAVTILTGAVAAAPVFPGEHPTSSWAWVLIGGWFGGIPLAMLTVAAVHRLLGKSPEEEGEES